MYGGAAAISTNPLWYKDAIFYELHVRSFYDSNGDGIGDFRGLTEKLDYLQDLGVTVLWLLPFYPSPLKDDGYDIADYAGVNPAYGRMRDVKELVRAAHRRGLRVVTEMVCNHTSDQHPWFQRARQAPAGSAWRDFYVWSDTAERYPDARIIFKDFEPSNWTWDPVAHAYYWHRFFSHQPDLNYDNPRVVRAVLRTVDFWLGLGVDGLRLDAVPYLYEREGTTCENLQETHAFLRLLRRHVDERFPDRMLLAEANQWPEDAAAYFGAGDECHMAFHFPLMPRLFMAVRMEDRFPVVDILQQTPAIADSCQWAVFLRNHDELTLEMVTDEERDYMYRVYANDPQARINLGIRRRLAPLLGNHRRRIELLNGLLFSLPGTPILYYGDEIGMGDNIYLGDRDGVRTPMQWSPDRNAGFSQANPQRLFLPVIVDPEYHYEAVNVEAQNQNPHSLLSWMKRLTALRKRYRALGQGSLEFLHPENRKILAFLRRLDDELLLVVANLSRFVQPVALDLAAHAGAVPVELFGHTEMPPVGEGPYPLTLGPHAFYWFALESRRRERITVERADDAARIPETAWEEFVRGGPAPALMAALPSYMVGARWFGGKGRRVRGVRLAERVAVLGDASLTLVEVDYAEGDPETYCLGLARAEEDGDRTAPRDGVVARTERGAVVDALREPAFCAALLEVIARRRRLRGARGTVSGSTTRAFRELQGLGGEVGPPSPAGAEQSNTSVIFGGRWMMKLFRHTEEGTSPELEIGRFLTERVRFRNTPALAGSLEYRRDGREPVTLGLLQAYVPNEGDGWQRAMRELADYYGRVATYGDPPPLPGASPLQMLGADAPDAVQPYMDFARLMGRRTGELHLALAGDPSDPGFAPEPMTASHQRSVYQEMRRLAGQAWETLAAALPRLPEDVRDEAAELRALEPAVGARLGVLRERRLGGQRIRCHGDFHLGQVLCSGADFVIVDFEGEPARSLQDRRARRSPLRDVAGMLRSFDYAAHAALPERPGARPWARLWAAWVSAGFLDGYLEAVGPSPMLPASREEVGLLLDVFRLEKAVYELKYDLQNRPDWCGVPLRAVLGMLR